MVRRAAFFWLSFGLALTPSSCSSPDGSDGAVQDESLGAEAPTIEVRDDQGDLLALASPPERIVSLVPSVTDILLTLGARSRLAGRTDYDMAPEVQSLPSVGGGLGASVERIVRLDPDLVIHFLAESDVETPRRLEAAGIAHLAVRPDRVGDIRRIVGLLGRIVGEDARADSLVAEMDAGLARVAASVEELPRPNVALLGGNPPTAAGPGTFLHELLEVAGGRNAFGELETLYAPISLEEVLRRDVDLILAPAETPIPPALSAIPTREIPVDVLIPGLGVVQSAELIAGLLHDDRTP